MGRASIKENKNVYQLKREELGLSREKASELLECVPPERIEKNRQWEGAATSGRSTNNGW